ncbi:S1C family serine protease [Hominifimenecus sp. rT4P-3]|uniref:S1C family serine protease n=1 Tax=Hominifimenecus sp. rT4P-3 TaxID=3242979 RepID=UPI003DA6AEB3
MAENPSEKQKEEKSEKREFIRETIVKQTPPKKWGRLAIACIGMGLIFGLAASLTFVVSRPFFEDRFGETETPESITIERDTVTPAPESTEASSAPTTENAAPVEREELERMIEAAVERSRNGIEDVRSIYTAVSNIMVEANKGLVVVTTELTGKDWFDNDVSSDQQSSGIIVAITRQEVLILTDSSILGEQDSVHITFGNHGEANGYRKQTDETTGLAVVAVAMEDLEDDLRAYIQPAMLGNSYLTTQGNPVIAMGSPMGAMRSVGFGIISYINSNVQGEDSQLRVMYTDIVGGSSSSGFLLNLDGEVVGWITGKYGSSDKTNVIRALSISDLKGVIERLSNGEQIANLGIRGQSVSSAASEEMGIPMGIYITKCVTDKPAYLAGLQSGDILTAIDGTAVAAMKDLQTLLEGLSADAQIRVTIQRSGREGYAEKVFTVQLMPR